MLIIKILVYSFIFLSSSLVGILLSKKYSDREEELKDFKNALNIFKTKIKYTYEPIPEVFSEIGCILKTGVSKIFKNASFSMQNLSAESAWANSMTSESLNIEKEDVNILLGLGKLLGKTDLDGQINEIELVESFLDLQISKAEEEKTKNENMYRKLGIIVGATIAIVLV